MISKKNLKPIEYDLHFKYLCPNPSCCFPHWLSLRETQTKNFKVVCVCDTIFGVKKIDRIKIRYAEKNKPAEPVQPSPPLPQKNSVSYVDKAICLLKTYGFDHSEASDMVKKCVSDFPDIVDHVTLVKHSLFLVKND